MSPDGFYIWNFEFTLSGRKQSQASKFGLHIKRISWTNCYRPILIYLLLFFLKLSILLYNVFQHSRKCNRQNKYTSYFARGCTLVAAIPPPGRITVWTFSETGLMKFVQTVCVNLTSCSDREHILLPLTLRCSLCLSYYRLFFVVFMNVNKYSILSILKNCNYNHLQRSEFIQLSIKTNFVQMIVVF